MGDERRKRWLGSDALRYSLPSPVSRLPSPVLSLFLLDAGHLFQPAIQSIDIFRA